LMRLANWNGRDFRILSERQNFSDTIIVNE